MTRDLVMLLGLVETLVAVITCKQKVKGDLKRWIMKV